MQYQKRLFLGVSLPFDRMKANLVCFMCCCARDAYIYILEKAAGVGKSSLTSSLLENPPPGCNEHVVKWLAGSLCKATLVLLYLLDCSSCFLSTSDSGSIDTSRATIATFLLNMTAHPEIQEKARAELNRVVGQERLPSLDE